MLLCGVRASTAWIHYLLQFRTWPGPAQRSSGKFCNFSFVLVRTIVIVPGLAPLLRPLMMFQYFPMHTSTSAQHLVSCGLRATGVSAGE